MWFTRWIYIVPMRWRSLFDRKRLDHALDEELRDHVARLTDAYRASGLTPDQARRAALVAMGGIQQRKEECRDMRRVTVIEDLFTDLRYALRLMRRSPSFTAVVVLTLALGIGANTAIFSVIDALLLRPLPVTNPEQLVTFRWDDDSTGPPTSFYTFDHTTFDKLRDLTRVFAGVSGSWVVGRSNVMVGGEGGGLDVGAVAVCFVPGNYFSTIGIKAIAGRTLTPEDDRVPGGHPVAVISHAYWRRRLAEASDVVGRTFTLNGTTYTILGVTPRGFTGDAVGTTVDLWIPYMMASQVMPEVPGGPARFPVRIVARLKPDVPIQQAQAAAQLFYQQIQQNRQARLELKRISTGLPSVHRDAYSQPLAIVMTVAVLVLLIACANVANLLLARSATRRREMAIRLAIGAGRRRIGRQLLTESLVLAALGGGLGVFVAIWGTNVLASTVAAGPVSMAAQTSGGLNLAVQMDARTLTFSAILSLFTGVLFGFAPAFRGSTVSLSAALGERAAGDTWRTRGPAKLLVISQVALSLLLVVGAGLFVRTFHNLKSQDLGFARPNLLMVWTTPGQTGRQDVAMADFWRNVQERLTALPGVVSASAWNGSLLNGYLPTSGRAVENMKVEGQPVRTTNRSGARSFVAPRFFETMGIPIVSGREFTERDTESAPRVAVINEAMARFYFGNVNPVGTRVGFSGDKGTPFEIVGVVKDFVRGTPRAVAQPEFSTYLSYRDREALNRGAQSRLRVMMGVIRATGDPRELTSLVRRELREIDPNLPVIRINTIDEQLGDVLVQERLVATLAGFFGALAILLATLGLYGVIAYAVARRTNEIGVRLALGATRAEVIGMVVREGILLVVAGVAIGLPVTLVATRLVANRLFGVGSADPSTFTAAVLAMLTVAILAAFLPARRAARIEPAVALRFE